MILYCDECQEKTPHNVLSAVDDEQTLEHRTDAIRRSWKVKWQCGIASFTGRNAPTTRTNEKRPMAKKPEIPFQGAGEDSHIPVSKENRQRVVQVRTGGKPNDEPDGEWRMSDNAVFGRFLSHRAWWK